MQRRRKRGELVGKNGRDLESGWGRGMVDEGDREWKREGEGGVWRSGRKGCGEWRGVCGVKENMWSMWNRKSKS